MLRLSDITSDPRWKEKTQEERLAIAKQFWMDEIGSKKDYQSLSIDARKEITDNFNNTYFNSLSDLQQKAQAEQQAELIKQQAKETQGHSSLFGQYWHEYFGTGIMNVVAGLQGLPKLVKDAVSNTIDNPEIANVSGINKGENLNPNSDYAKQKANFTDSPVARVIRGFAEKQFINAQGSQKTAEALAIHKPSDDTGAIGLIAQGKVGKALDLIIRQSIDSAPMSSIAMAATIAGVPNVGLGFFGAQAAGSDYASTVAEPMSMGAKIQHAGMIGMTEALSELFTVENTKQWMGLLKGIANTTKKEAVTGVGVNLIKSRAGKGLYDVYSKETGELLKSGVNIKEAYLLEGQAKKIGASVIPNDNPYAFNLKTADKQIINGIIKGRIKQTISKTVKDDVTKTALQKFLQAGASQTAIGALEQGIGEGAGQYIEDYATYLIKKADGDNTATFNVPDALVNSLNNFLVGAFMSGMPGAVGMGAGIPSAIAVDRYNKPEAVAERGRKKEQAEQILSKLKQMSPESQEDIAMQNARDLAGMEMPASMEESNGKEVQTEGQANEQTPEEGNVIESNQVTPETAQPEMAVVPEKQPLMDTEVDTNGHETEPQIATEEAKGQVATPESPVNPTGKNVKPQGQEQLTTAPVTTQEVSNASENGANGKAHNEVRNEVGQIEEGSGVNSMGNSEQTPHANAQQQEEQQKEVTNDTGQSGKPDTNTGNPNGTQEGQAGGVLQGGVPKEEIPAGQESGSGKGAKGKGKGTVGKNEGTRHNLIPEEVVKTVKQADHQQVVDAVKTILPKTNPISHETTEGNTTTIRLQDGKEITVNTTDDKISVTLPSGEKRTAGGRMIPGKTAEGSLSALIQIAHNYNIGNLKAYHEAGHLAYYMFLSDTQRTLLQRHFAKKINRASMQEEMRQRGVDTEEALTEEYIMDGFAEYSRNKDSLKGKPFLARAFNKIMEGIKWLAKKLGIRNYEMVFDEMRKGEYENGKPLKGKTSLSPSELAEYMEADKKYRGTDQWLKAPNGKTTNLSERQWVQVRTPSFIQWFGDWMNDPKNASKVIDENGEPLVVYHGTRNYGFTIFDKELRGSENDTSASKKAFWFTANKQVSQWFSQTHEGNVYSVFLNIKDPTITDDARLSRGELISGVGHNKRRDTVQKAIRTRKDGSIFNNTIDFGGDRTTNFAVFESTQIKSATDNVGTFDINNPDIRYSLDRKADTKHAEEMAREVKELVDAMAEPLNADKKAFTKEIKNLQKVMRQQINIEQFEEKRKAIMNKFSEYRADTKKVTQQQLHALISEVIDYFKNTMNDKMLYGLTENETKIMETFMHKPMREMDVASILLAVSKIKTVRSLNRVFNRLDTIIDRSVGSRIYRYTRAMVRSAMNKSMPARNKRFFFQREDLPTVIKDKLAVIDKIMSLSKDDITKEENIESLKHDLKTAIHNELLENATEEQKSNADFTKELLEQAVQQADLELLNYVKTFGLLRNMNAHQKLMALSSVLTLINDGKTAWNMKADKQLAVNKQLRHIIAAMYQTTSEVPNVGAQTKLRFKDRGVLGVTKSTFHYLETLFEDMDRVAVKNLPKMKESAKQLQTQIDNWELPEIDDKLIELDDAYDKLLETKTEKNAEAINTARAQNRQERRNIIKARDRSAYDLQLTKDMLEATNIAIGLAENSEAKAGFFHKTFFEPLMEATRQRAHDTKVQLNKYYSKVAEFAHMQHMSDINIATLLVKLSERKWVRGEGGLLIRPRNIEVLNNQTGEYVKVAHSWADMATYWSLQDTENGRATLKNSGYDERSMAQINKYMDEQLTPRQIEWNKTHKEKFIAPGELMKKIVTWTKNEFMEEFWLSEINPKHREVTGVDAEHEPAYQTMYRNMDKEIPIAGAGDNVKYIQPLMGVNNPSLIKRNGSTLTLKHEKSDWNAMVINHIMNQEHWKNMIDVSMKFQAVFGAKYIQSMMRNQYGSKFRNIFIRYMNDVFSDSFSSMGRDDFSKAINWMKNHFVGAVLMQNGMLLPKQASSVVTFAVGYDNMKDMTNYAFATLDPAHGFLNARRVRRLFHDSPVLVDRYGKGFTYDIMMAMGINGEISKSSLVAMRLNKIYNPAQAGDWLSVFVGGGGYYLYKYDQYIADGFSDEESHQRAIRDFEMLVQRTQQSSEIPFIPDIQRSSAIGAAVSTFQSQMYAYLNTLYNDIEDYRAGRIKAGKLAQDLTYILLIAPALFSVIAGGFAIPDEWDKFKNWLLRIVLAYDLSIIPVIGNLLQAGLNGNVSNATLTPALTGVTDAIANAWKGNIDMVFKGEIDTKALMADAKVAGYVARLPVTPATNNIKGVVDFINDPSDTEIARLFGMSKAGLENYQRQLNQ